MPVPRLDAAVSAKKAVYYPATLDTSLLPLSPDAYVFEAREILNATTVYTFYLLRSEEELYSFAIWGREYTTDGDEPSGNNSTETTTPTPTPGPDGEPDSSTVHRLHFVLFIFCTLALLRY